MVIVRIKENPGTLEIDVYKGNKEQSRLYASLRCDKVQFNNNRGLELVASPEGEEGYTLIQDNGTADEEEERQRESSAS